MKNRMMQYTKRPRKTDEELRAELKTSAWIHKKLLAEKELKKQQMGIVKPIIELPDTFQSDILNETNCLLADMEGPLPSTFRSNEITGTQLLTEAPGQMDFVVEGLFPRTGMGAIAGGSDTGKSTILRQLAMDITSGEVKFIDFALNPRHKSAIMVCTEDDRHAVSYLMRKQAGIKDPNLFDGLRFVFEYENLLQELDQMLTNNPADLVIVDCFADAFGGDLKDTQKIRSFLSGYKQLSDKHGCFILFLHHTGKRTEDLAPSKNNLLSGQGFESKMRLVMELKTDPMHANYRHLCIVKGNYLPRSMKSESYVLLFNEETFQFSFTGERTPFELLVKQNEDGSRSKFDQAKELKAKGYNYDKIAETLGYGSKGSISKLFDKAEKNGWQ